MKRPIIIMWFSVCFPLLGATVVRAQENNEAQGYYVAQAAQPPEPVQPPTAAPGELPPAPPAQPPAPPVQAEAQAPEQAQAPNPQGQASGGQWVYTSQYGWVYMPYGDQYVSDGTATDSNPYEYAYCPGQGWTWLSAPWVIGWGPYPYYGTLGAGNYAWVHGRQGRTLRLQRYDGTPSDGYTSFGGPDRRANQPSYSGALRGPRAWAGYGGNASSASVGYAGSNRGSVSGAPDGRHGGGGTVRPTGGAGGDSASSRGYRGASSLGGGSMGGGRSSGTTSHWGGYGGASSQGGGASTGRSGARSAGPR